MGQIEQLFAVPIQIQSIHHQTSINANEIYFLTGRDGKHTNLIRYINFMINYNDVNVLCYFQYIVEHVVRLQAHFMDMIKEAYFAY